jgi:hypothetical protein
MSNSPSDPRSNTEKEIALLEELAALMDVSVELIDEALQPLAASRLLLPERRHKLCGLAKGEPVWPPYAITERTSTTFPKRPECCIHVANPGRINMGNAFAIVALGGAGATSMAQEDVSATARLIVRAVEFYVFYMAVGPGASKSDRLEWLTKQLAEILGVSFDKAREAIMSLFTPPQSPDAK